MTDVVQVYVGTDVSQLGAAEVLKQTILETSLDKKVDIHFMDKLSIPQPKDVRQSQRTGFSFARWAIPELCGYRGRAIYLDADMMVFKDIRGLWETPMNGATIAFVDGTDTSFCSDKAKGNKNETSVMLIDCEKAKWTLAGLVQGLDGKYTYKDMMSDLCFLNEKDLSRTIPRKWNAMDFWDENVHLLHFTNVPTQPWVSVDNPYGHVWVGTLKRLIEQSKIEASYIYEQIVKGYFRPSLRFELQGEINLGRHPAYTEKLRMVDKQAGFVAHRDLALFSQKRERAIRLYELMQAYQGDKKQFIRHAANYALVEAKQVAKKILKKT